MNYQEPVPPGITAAPAAASSHAPIPAVRMRRAILWASAIALIVVGLLIGFDLSRQQMMKSFFAANVPPPVNVSYETVVPGPVSQSLSTIGSIAAVHQVMISPEVAGTVTAIAFQPGQVIKAGDLVVQLNDASERAELASFRAQLRLADSGLKRARELAGRSAASQAQLDQAQSQYDVAAAGIARTEAVIAQKAVRAPFDGTLGVRLTEVGDYLERGAPVVQITNLDDLFVEFALPEQTRPLLDLGQRVDLTVDAFPDRVFPGLIAVIDPQINVATRTMKIQAVMANADRALTPGMFAAVNVVLPPAEGQLTVSETALSYSLYGNAVFVVDDTGSDDKGGRVLKAKRSAVRTGTTSDGRVVVVDGLKAGDRVVTTGLGKLFDGALLNLTETPTLVKPDAVPRP